MAADGVGRGVHVRPPGHELHVVQADGADVKTQLLQSKYGQMLLRYESWTQEGLGPPPS